MNLVPFVAKIDALKNLSCNVLWSSSVGGFPSETADFLTSLLPYFPTSLLKNSICPLWMIDKRIPVSLVAAVNLIIAHFFEIADGVVLVPFQ